MTDRSRAGARFGPPVRRGTSMKAIHALAAALVVTAFPIIGQSQQPAPIVVAAENFYGDLARQIAGPGVIIISILINPNQDPHDFEASPSTARLVADANLVIYNGADYDPWIETLLKASKSANRRTIVAADLMDRKSGDNPHLWYDPATMPVVAKAIAGELERADPGHAADYDAHLEAFLTSLQPMNDRIAQMRGKFAGTEVTATEPVFGYMAEALGFKMRNQRFQIAVMNGTEPSAADVAALEDDLRSHRVKVLFYNNQATDDLTARLRKVAKDSKVSIVGVSETAPAGMVFQDWMSGQLDAIDKALSAQGS